MADKTRIVVWYDAINNVCRVWPPWGIGATGDHVIWFNHTGQSMHVHVDKGVFKPANAPVDLDIDDNKHDKADIDNGASPGNYLYNIYCNRTLSNAVGTSPPEIIVE